MVTIEEMLKKKPYLLYAILLLVVAAVLVAGNGQPTGLVGHTQTPPPVIKNTPPVAVAGADPTSGDTPLAVSFSGLSSYDPDGQIVQYQWDFGDGTQEFNQVPQTSHTYTSEGTFTVTLLVTDDLGGTDSTTEAYC